MAAHRLVWTALASLSAVAFLAACGDGPPEPVPADDSTATPAAPASTPVSAPTPRAGASPESRAARTPTNTPEPVPADDSTATPAAPVSTPVSAPTPRAGASPESLAAINALPWVQDGVASHEEYAASGLRLMAEVSERTFEELMRRGWVVETGDDPHYIEPFVISALAGIAGEDEETAERIAAMPFLETVEYGDMVALDVLSGLLVADPDGAVQVLALPALQDGITDAQAAEIPLLYLEMLHPAAAEAIRSLPWVRDGEPTQPAGDFDSEPGAVAMLQYLAVEFPDVFRAVMKRPWIQGTTEGFTGDRAQVVDFIITIARIDGSAALQITEMPFLESVEMEDQYRLEIFLALLNSDPDGVRELLSDPALSGGGEVGTAADLALLYLKSQGPEVSAAIDALPWIQDGIEPIRDSEAPSIHPSKSSLEHQAILNLSDIYVVSGEAALSLLKKPWARDGFDIREFTALGRLRDIVLSMEEAARVIGMPFLETFEASDLAVLEILETLARSDPSGLDTLLSDPALSSGITDGQIADVALAHLRLENDSAAGTIESLPWVMDGTGSDEQRQVLALKSLAMESSEVFRSLVGRPWVRDGLGPDEVTVVGSLTAMSGKSYGDRRDEAAALRIIDMPFLEVIDGIDATAMASLLVLFQETDEGYLERVLSHPTLRGGITDDHTVVVASLELVVRHRPELLDTLLDPGQVQIEKRVIDLPHTGLTTLAVVYVSPGDYDTMDVLERAARAQEAFMGAPFPRNYVGLLVAEVTQAGGGGGGSGMISVAPSNVESGYVIAHELAHTYWYFFPQWIAEGAADFMTTVSADEIFSSNECSLADSLSDLDRLHVERAEQGLSNDAIYWSGCPYALGRGLFIDLHESLGDEAFRQGFLRLYLAMRDEAHDDKCSGPERGVCYVRAAFVTEAQPESAALAGPLIARHYHGPGQPPSR